MPKCSCVVIYTNFAYYNIVTQQDVTCKRCSLLILLLYTNKIRPNKLFSSNISSVINIYVQNTERSPVGDGIVTQLRPGRPLKRASARTSYFPLLQSIKIDCEFHSASCSMSIGFFSLWSKVAGAWSC